MPSIKWNHVRANPRGALKIILLASFSSIKEILLRLVRPFKNRPLRLRNALARLWLGTVFAVNPLIFYSADESREVQRVTRGKAEFYLVPSVDLSTDKLRSADAVVLFAHGGGMIMGHPLQYLDEYERWAKAAVDRRKKVVFVAVRYPLSTERKWPAQRVTTLDTYQWILDQGVPADKVIMAGDSAGGNLVVLTLMHIRDQARHIPMPAGVVLMSPWVDMTAVETGESPNFPNDFMFNYKKDAPVMNNLLRPTDLPYDTPEISAVLGKNVGGLPRQLVFYSPTELLATDSERWVKRSLQAGVDISVHKSPGEMHTFAVGWPVSSRSVSSVTDDVFLSFMLASVQRR